MTREEKIKAIILKVGPTRFGGNEYGEFDFVMYGDVVEYIAQITGNDMNFQSAKIKISWKEKRKPIEAQSDDCIDYIYTLIN